jgi:hypothetical protein
LQAERATPYLSTIVASEDLLNTICHWTWDLILIRSCLVAPIEPDLLTLSTRSCRTLTHMVSTVFLTFTAVESPLSLPSSTIDCILIALLLGHASDGGIVDKGGTDSTTITPCRSSNVAVAGTVVVTSLVTSPYGVINMATIVCGGMCAGGGGRDSARGG